MIIIINYVLSKCIQVWRNKYFKERSFPMKSNTQTEVNSSWGTWALALGANYQKKKGVFKVKN